MRRRVMIAMVLVGSLDPVPHGPLLPHRCGCQACRGGELIIATGSWVYSAQRNSVPLAWERVWYNMSCGTMKARVGNLPLPRLEELGRE